MDAFQAAKTQAAAARGADMGMAVILPDIPLWVPEDARREITALVVGTVRLILQTTAGYISDGAPVGATGQLAQSFGADPATETGGLEMLGVDLGAGVAGRVFSSLPYAIVMENGRRPGAPISREGIDAIGYWLQRKLGMSSDEAAQVKWAVARAIVDQGIEGKHFVEAAWQRMEPRANQMMTGLADDIVAILAGKQPS